MLQLGEDRHGGLRRCRKALAHRLRAGGRRPWRGWEQWEVAIGDEEGGREGSETGGLRWGSASKIPVWDGRHGGRLGRGGRWRAGWEVVLAGVGGGREGARCGAIPNQVVQNCTMIHVVIEQNPDVIRTKSISNSSLNLVSVLGFRKMRKNPLQRLLILPHKI